MKISVDIADFNSILKKIDKMSIPKITNPILEYYKLSVSKNNELKITRATYDISVSGCVDGITTEYGSICVHDKVINIIKKIKTGMMTITDDKIIVGTKEIIFNRHDGSEYIDFKLDDITDREAFKVTEDEFVRLLETSYCRSIANETRPQLNGVFINESAFCAVDGYRLSVRKTNQFDINENILLNDSTVRYLNKILDKKSTKSITCRIDNDKKVEFTIGDITVVSNLINLEFMAYKSIIPDMDEAKTIVNIKDIDELIKSLEFIGEADKQALIKLNVTEDSMLIENNNASCVLRDDYKHIDLIGDETEICFNNKYLLDSIKMYKGKENVSLYMYSRVSPMVISSNKDDLELVLPVRIDAKSN